MDVKIGIGEASVTGADGIVWHEKFELWEAEEISVILQGRIDAGMVAPVLRDAVQRVAEMFQALSNDSDACIVTASPE